MVDLHSHVLPGIDDGPQTLEGSVALCRASQRDGTRTLVATPHVSWDYPNVTAEVVRVQVAAVNGALHDAALDLTVQAGGEVALSRAGELSDAELGGVALGAGKYILLELPWRSAGSGDLHALRALAGRGYGIVLAHPERSSMLQRDGRLIRELVDAGVLLCLNADSLTGRAGPLARTTAWRLLGAGLAHVIASDSHDAVRRPPTLRSTAEQAGLTAHEIDYFTRQAPEAILNGEAAAPPPAIEDRRRRRWLPRRGL